MGKPYKTFYFSSFCSLSVAKALAYYVKKSITAVKSFIV